MREEGRGIWSSSWQECAAQCPHKKSYRVVLCGQQCKWQRERQGGGESSEEKREFSGTIYQAGHLTPFASHCCQRKSAYKTPLGGVAQRERGRGRGRGVGQVRIVDQDNCCQNDQQRFSISNLLQQQRRLLVIVSIVNSHDLRS